MNQSIKLIALFLVFASLATMALGIIPRASATSPEPITGNMLIKIYLDPSQEEAALATGDIDINDWPLSSTFITSNAANSAITLNNYAEIGEYEFDINNQLWPTGPNPLIGGTRANPVGPQQGFFNPTGVRDLAALHFRRAIAHLSNKAKYTTDFMGGYGYVLQTAIPVPAMQSYTDYTTLTNTTAQADPYGSSGGYIYGYSRAAAIAELTLGGFKDWQGVGHIQWSGDNGVHVEELPNMKLWARLDDPNRRQAGQDLYNEMLAVGIPAAASPGAPGLDLHIAERSTEFAAVMVSYDYNIYTGGWSLTADPDGIIYDLFHSSMGQYSYANNYPGFQNHEYDPFAQGVKFAPDIPTATYNAIQAQWVFAKYTPVIELWAAKGVKGYRTGWTGVVNYAGSGTDNGLSFMDMNWTDGAGNSRSGPANTIVYGFKSDISALQVMTSEWIWDWNVLNQIYDTLLTRNPYNLAEEVGTLATDWNTSVTWPGWSGKTVAWFTLRTDAFFHNGDPVTPADVAYSLLAVRDAGAGNAWNFPTVFQVDHVQIVGQQIGVFFNVQSAWALHWAGFMPIIDENLWNAATAIGPGSASGYNGFIPHNTNGNFGSPASTYTNAANIRNFHPWETTDAAGHLYLTDDGSWGFSFVSYSVGNNVALKAYTAANGFIHPMYKTIYVPNLGWMELDTSFKEAVPVNAVMWKNIHGPQDYLNITFANPTTLEFQWGFPEPVIHFDNDTTVTFPDIPGGQTMVTFENGTGTKTYNDTSVFIKRSTVMEINITKPFGQITFPAGTTIQLRACFKVRFVNASVITITGRGYQLSKLNIKIPQEIDVAKRQFFNKIGNVNYPDSFGDNMRWYGTTDNVISILDLSYVANSLTTTDHSLWGPSPGQYNPDADFLGAFGVNIIDLVIAGSHFGQKSG